MHAMKPLRASAEYERLHERERFLESVAAGLADAEAGRVIDTAELREQLSARQRAKKGQ